MAITIAIVDDHPLALEGLQNMLLSSGNIQIMGTYTTGTALLDSFYYFQPDILLLDILMPDQKGNELAAYITQHYPKIKMIAITSLDAPLHVRAMMRQGCKGYILKNTDKHSLVNAIEKVQAGEEFIEPGLKEKMLDNVLHHRKMSAGKSYNLTTREKQILKLIVEEFTSQQIADKLFLSLRTVETHRFNLQKKLDVNNTIGLVKVALQMGLVN